MTLLCQAKGNFAAFPQACFTRDRLRDANSQTIAPFGDMQDVRHAVYIEDTATNPLFSHRRQHANFRTLFVNINAAAAAIFFQRQRAGKFAAV
jgi:hypothetical protein